MNRRIKAIAGRLSLRPPTEDAELQAKKEARGRRVPLEDGPGLQGRDLLLVGIMRHRARTGNAALCDSGEFCRASQAVRAASS